MKILLVGGGSGGPVMPLIAVAEKIKQERPTAKFLLVGTKKGPESILAKNSRIDFTFISAPKLRRYFSFKNFALPFLLVYSFFQSIKVLNSFKPDCVFGAGSFVQVPMVWAAYFKRIPVVLHQQDILPSLANKLCQFCAKKITLTFEFNKNSFYDGLGLWYKNKPHEKILVTGNPFREELKSGSKEKGYAEFNLNKDLPVLLVLGGGTGAKFINELIWDTLPSMAKIVQIIHATGPGKMEYKGVHENYHPYEFINNMADAYAVADFVLCRAGLSTITELSNLKKISIILPMPYTHQEFNATYLKTLHAAIVLDQNNISLSGFVAFIRKLIFAQEAQISLKQNISLIMPHGATAKIAKMVVELSKKHE